MSIQHVAALALEGLLALLTVYTAYSLFAWTPPSIAGAREPLRYPHWYWLLAGGVASAGAIGLFVGLAIPVVGAVAAAWMVAYFVVALLTHLVRTDLKSLGFPFVFLAVFVGLLLLRWADAGPALALIGLH